MRKIVFILLAALAAVGLSLFPVPKSYTEPRCPAGATIVDAKCKRLPQGTKVTHYGLPMVVTSTYTVPTTVAVDMSCPVDTTSGVCRAPIVVPEPSFSLMAFGVNLAAWLIVFGIVLSLIRRQKPTKREKK